MNQSLSGKTGAVHYSLTPGLRPAIAHGLNGNPITVSGLDGLTRSSPAAVTPDLAVSGSGSGVTTLHFTMIRTDGAEEPLPITNGGLRLAEAVTTPPPDAHTHARIYADRLTDKAVPFPDPVQTRWRSPT